MSVTIKNIATVRSRNVRPEDGHIVWEWPTSIKGFHTRSFPGSVLIEEFVGLAGRTDDVLLRFARKYGPLGLCEHGFAMGHRDRFNKRCYSLDYGVEDINNGVHAREPVHGWRRYIARANGILTVAAILREQKATEDEWSWLFDEIPRNRTKATHVEQILGVKGYKLVSFGTEDPRPYLALLTGRKEDRLMSNPLIAVLATHRRDTLRKQRQALAAVLNHWLDECETGINVSWSEPGVDVGLGISAPLGGGNRLLVAIGAQLLDAVVNRDTYSRCDSCHGTYKPARRPRAGQKH